MQAILFSRGFSRKFTLIFATSYALAALAVFVDMFFWFMMGRVMQFQEPNVIIAAAELASTILSLIILTIYLLELLGIRMPSSYNSISGEAP